MLACQADPQPSTDFLADRGATNSVDLNCIASFWTDHQGLRSLHLQAAYLAARRDQANFANHRLAAMQTLRVEAWPDLL